MSFWFIKNKKNFQNISIYLLASIIPMAVNLIINPLIAQNMAPLDYAIVGFYGSFNALLTPLISFYSFAYYAKRYFEVDVSERLVLKETILRSLVFLSLFLSLVSLAAIYIYMTVFNKDSEISFFPYAILSIATIFFTGIFTFKLVDFKMQKNSKLFFNFSVSKGAITASLSILLVVILKFGALGKMSAVFITMFIIFVYLIYKDFGLYKKKIDWKIFKEMLLFVWPLIIAAMMEFFTNGYDKVYLERLGNANELGYYVVASQIVGYIGVFQIAVANTFQPDIFKSIVNKRWRTTAKYIGIMIISVLSVVIAFVVVAPLIIDILTAGRYTYSAKYARILAFSQITSILFFITNDIIIVLGYTFMSLLNKIIGVILIIGMYKYFVATWGFVGGGWGRVASYILLSFINVVVLMFWIKLKKYREKGIYS